ncbi:MAG: GNAT family N-acetyltransferase [Clostridia bacterium]|nr:GNAT family N-acetyltransferase [Clostridia bacterium]
MTRQFRKLNPEDMKQYMEIYLNAYPAGKDLSGECYDKYYDRNLKSMKDFDHVTFYGLFEGDKLIAQAKFIDFDVNLFGKMRKAKGLMALGVHPLEKKKGAAKDMVLAFEEETDYLAMLLPFRVDFYRDMGYGCGTKIDEYHILTEYLPDVDTEGVKFIPRENFNEMLECHREFVRNYHGACYKFEEEVRDFKADEEGRWLGYYEDGKLLGYAIFDFENVSDTNYTLNQMVIRELVYLNQQALGKLLSAIRLQSDLAQSVVIRTGEMDFHHLLKSPQHVDGYYIDFGFMKTNVSAIGTMYKIVDIEKFVEETSHRRFVNIPLKVSFNIYDELKHEEKKFTLKFKDGSYSYSKEEGQVQVNMNLSDFSALMMGSAEFSALERMGVLKVDKPEYIRDLDSLFHVEQKPFTNTDY